MADLTPDEDAELIEKAMRRRLDPIIRRIAQHRAAMLRQTDSEKLGEARLLWMSAPNLIWEAIGTEALKLAYGEDPPEDSPNEVHLEELLWRLAPIEHIFAPIADRKAKSSVSSAMSEIQAIAHGDYATLFVPPPRKRGQGKEINAFQLVRHQLRALEWDAYLEFRGFSAGERQGDIAKAFAKSWDTIRKWRSKQCVAHLGEEWVARRIASARAGKPHMLAHDLEENWAVRLTEDGKAYKVENRKSLKVI